MVGITRSKVIFILPKFEQSQAIVCLEKKVGNVDFSSVCLINDLLVCCQQDPEKRSSSKEARVSSDLKRLLFDPQNEQVNCHGVV